MKRLLRTLERVSEEIIDNDYDAIILYVGNEGAGKSTIMLEITWLWQQIRGLEPTVDSVLDRVIFDNRADFKQQLLDSDRARVQNVMDAAHILHKKEAMHGEQIDVEKSLLDIRTFNYLIQLGYQDWEDVSDQLQRRRAKFAFRIPRRGVVWAYSRASMDHKYDTGDWPDPDFKDRFPPLDGTELWDAYENMDEARKRERLEVADEPDAEDVYYNTQLKTVLRAVKPWDPEKGMLQTDAAELIDYSESWVSNRISEWNKGYYRDLLPDEELEAIQATAVNSEAA